MRYFGERRKNILGFIISELVSKFMSYAVSALYTEMCPSMFTELSSRVYDFQVPRLVRDFNYVVVIIYIEIVTSKNPTA